ncbi:T9SS type A sorting domain-containing protein [Hymenobacter gummosus]|uniref:T9SS type A sorting domain-containing protein n=1 Tax=Hymenobacter gummosus TaxID=1776032 RepID=A0A431U5P2_9BACT|nr:T9SS type A sorting domain-containing protein [Hymenobacter gummosus]RTQ51498.1 T9SS type A sorting domain-containing protein [Hymenobacter gummosus]
MNQFFTHWTRAAARRLLPLLLLTPLLPGRASQAQTTAPYGWQWATGLTTTSTMWGRALARDAAGNLYVTGWYNGAGTQSTAALPTVAPYDQNFNYNTGLYLAKLNATGAVQWTTTLNGPGEDGGTRVAVDASGNVYVAGRLSGPQTIGSSSLPGLPGRQSYTFLAKFNSSGVAQWGVQGVFSGDLGNTWHTPNALAVDAAGNVYAGMGGVTKYDAAGTVLWNTPMAGLVQSLSMGSQGQVVAAGSFAGNGVFGTGAGAVTLSSQAGQLPNGFTAQLSSAGSLQWAKAAVCTGKVYNMDATPDAAGNVYALGSTNGGNGLIQFGSTSVSGQTYLAKYSSTGNLVWAQDVTGTPGDYSRAAVTTATGTTYIGASGRIMAIDAAGTQQWTRHDNLERVFALVPNGNDELYVAGNYRNSGGTAGSIILAGNGTSAGLSAFVGKLSNTATASRPAQLAQWSVYPNPNGTGLLHLRAAAPLSGPARLVLTNALGQVVKNTAVPAMPGAWRYDWPVQDLPKGLYVVQLSTGQGRQSTRVVLE